jgi:hypothetical protein
MLKNEHNQNTKPNTGIASRWKAENQKRNSPKSKIGRWINFCMLMAVALGSFLEFYIIRFELCGNFKCRELEITGIWYLFSPGFMLFGAAVLMVARFILDEESLPSSYSDYITFSIVTAMLFMLFIPFGISAEIGSTVNTP